MIRFACLRGPIKALYHKPTAHARNIHLGIWVEAQPACLSRSRPPMMDLTRRSTGSRTGTYEAAVSPLPKRQGRYPVGESVKMTQRNALPRKCRGGNCVEQFNGARHCHLDFLRLSCRAFMQNHSRILPLRFGTNTAPARMHICIGTDCTGELSAFRPDLPPDTMDDAY